MLILLFVDIAVPPFSSAAFSSAAFSRDHRRGMKEPWILRLGNLHLNACDCHQEFHQYPGDADSRCTKPGISRSGIALQDICDA